MKLMMLFVIFSNKTPSIIEMQVFKFVLKKKAQQMTKEKTPNNLFVSC